MNNDNRAAEIAQILRRRAAAMAPGEKLPAVRELVSEFHASAATVSHAVAHLKAAGILKAEPGRGTFVVGRERLPEADYSWQSQTLGRSRVEARRTTRLGAYGRAEDIQLSWGYLAAELQPRDELRSAAARAARASRAWDMMPTAGLPDLRRVFAEQFRAEPADALIVPGGQQALVYALRTLADPGATLITESPTYPGAVIAAQAAGLELQTVPSDLEGVRPDMLAEALERSHAKIVYLQPCYANPTGAVLTSDRRRQVLELAAEHGAFIIEDDWARHLAMEGAPPRPLFTEDPHGHVVTITTLTKPIAPGMRVAAILARGPAGNRLREARVADDMCVPAVLQETALGLLTSTAWPRHLKRLRSRLLERRDAMLADLHRSGSAMRCVQVPTGGIHLWVRLPEGTNTTAMSRRAQDDGVLISDGSLFFVDEPSAAYLRLSYAAASLPQIAEGIRRLTGCVGG